MMKTIAVTGATGFVGKRFIEYNGEKYSIQSLPLRTINVETLNLKGVDAIVHLAGKAHQMEAIVEQIYFDINYGLTKTLIDRAIVESVPHFIYISSTKVYGDDIHTVLNEQSECKPTDAYGASKLQAEQYVLSLGSNIKVAIVRPPLVYGPEVKGNMIQMLHLAQKNIPLPFGNTGNQRSMVFLDNLIELINTIIDQQATGIFVAGDIKPISTNELVSLVRKYLGRSERLITIPSFLKLLIKKVIPKLYIRLFGSFVVENSKTNNQLKFTPPYSSEFGIEQMTKWYKQINNNKI